MKIYIAGPYTASTDLGKLENVRKAMDAGLKVFKKGHTPFIPHLMHYVDKYAEVTGVPMEYQDYMNWDNVWLRECDAILVLAESPGVKVELEEANRLRLKVFNSIDEIEVEKPIVKAEVVQSGVTCPARVQQVGPWEHKECLDSWEKRGPDVCCSFCGAIHPEDFLAILKQAADPASAVMIERATGKSKWYVHRAEVPTAAEGGIKTYGYHLMHNQWSAEIQTVMLAATTVSQAKFDKKLQQTKKTL